MKSNETRLDEAEEEIRHAKDAISDLRERSAAARDMSHAEEHRRMNEVVVTLPDTIASAVSIELQRTSKARDRSLAELRTKRSAVHSVTVVAAALVAAVGSAAAIATNAPATATVAILTPVVALIVAAGIRLAASASAPHRETSKLNGSHPNQKD